MAASLQVRERRRGRRVVAQVLAASARAASAELVGRGGFDGRTALRAPGEMRACGDEQVCRCRTRGSCLDVTTGLAGTRVTSAVRSRPAAGVRLANRRAGRRLLLSLRADAGGAAVRRHRSRQWSVYHRVELDIGCCVGVAAVWPMVQVAGRANGRAARDIALGSVSAQQFDQAFGYEKRAEHREHCHRELIAVPAPPASGGLQVSGPRAVLSSAPLVKGAQGRLRLAPGWRPAAADGPRRTVPGTRDAAQVRASLGTRDP
jgi:hypothetical protein